MFHFILNFAKYQLFGLDFLQVYCLPQAKCFLGKLQQNGSVASQHKAWGKTHIAPVIDYTHEKSCLGDPVMASHTGKGIWHLWVKNGPPAAPVWFLSKSGTLQAFQKLQFLQTLFRVRKLHLCASSVSLDHNRKKAEGSFGLGWGETMDKLWEHCLPTLWVLQNLLAHKRSVAANQRLLEKQCLQAH